MKTLDWEDLPWTGKLLVAVLYVLTKLAWTVLHLVEAVGWWEGGTRQ